MLSYSAILALMFISGLEGTLQSSKSEFQGYRLPNNTKPLWYDIHLITKVHTGANSYSGMVTIAIKAVQDTDYIVVHADKSLQILKLNVIDNTDGTDLGELNYVQNTTNDFLIISSDQESFYLKEGQEYSLIVAFSGSHRQYRKGFYKSEFRTEQNQVVFIASTFFKPQFARLAFPCYDEPMLKAKFKIAITHGANYTVAANMPISEEIPPRGDDMKTTRFQQTPLMSTYTLGFLVGNYDKVSTIINGTEHRIFSQPWDEEKGEFFLDFASKVLRLCENYFGIKYSLPKLDHIRVPMFTADGAMENWGLITYDSGHILRYKNSAGRLNFETALLMTKKIVQQWFGNLVTPKWWNHVWLTEGISSFYSYKILELLHPELKLNEYQLTIGCEDYWNEPEWRPLSQYFESQRDILDNFEDVFYCKGHKIMQMFEHALTSDTLKNAIQDYLRKNQFSVVEEDDFFECLQKAATHDQIPVFKEQGVVKKIISSWTQQVHYPLITVKRDYKTGSFNVSQSPVYNYGISNQLWWIPITFATASQSNFNGTTADFIIPDKQEVNINPEEFNMTLLKDDWLILNKQQIGMFRVKYDEKNWDLIIDALKKDPGVIHSYNRAQLIRDAKFAHKNSMMSSEMLFAFLSYLKNEIDIVPWFEGAKVMDSIHRNLAETQSVNYVEYFLKDMISNILNSIGRLPKSNDTAVIDMFRKRFLYLFVNVGLIDRNDILEEL